MIIKHSCRNVMKYDIIQNKKQREIFSSEIELLLRTCPCPIKKEINLYRVANPKLGNLALISKFCDYALNKKFVAAVGMLSKKN